MPHCLQMRFLPYTLQHSVIPYFVFLYTYLLHKIVSLWRLNNIEEDRLRERVEKEQNGRYYTFISLYSILYGLGVYYSYYMTELKMIS